MSDGTYYTIDHTIEFWNGDRKMYTYSSSEMEIDELTTLADHNFMSGEAVLNALDQSKEQIEFEMRERLAIMQEAPEWYCPTTCKVFVIVYEHSTVDGFAPVDTDNTVEFEV